MSQALELRSGGARCQVAPSLGGALLGFSVGDRNYLRASPRAMEVTDSACFPMVPYCNRIVGGAVRSACDSWPIEPNFGAPPLPCHGDGWQSVWTVEARSASSLRLVMSSSRAPFSFTAWQTVTLDNNSLSLGLSVRNDAAWPMPMGLGFHPFFAESASATVIFNARCFWLEGPDKLPTQAISLPTELDHAEGRGLTAWRNNCYEGWNGLAEIRWRDGARVTMEAQGGMSYLHLYHPPGLNFFCLEPQTHLSGAAGRADGGDHGIRRLGPGEVLSAALRLSAYRDRH